MAGQKTDDRDVLLGRRIAEHRKRSKLTQRIVADSFGMSAAQLQKYEKGVNRISAIHLAILSRMTGTPVSAFLDGIASTEEGPDTGFSEADQQGFDHPQPWSDVARAIARQVSESMGEDGRREFATAVEVLNRELKS